MKPIISQHSDLILRSKPSPEGRRLASRRMAACTAVARGHPSRRIARATLLRMRSGEDADIAELAEHLVRFRDRAEDMVERRCRDGRDKRRAVAVELIVPAPRN